MAESPGIGWVLLAVIDVGPGRDYAALVASADSSLAGALSELAQHVHRDADAEAAEAVRMLVAGHTDALGPDSLQAAFRETQGGYEILVVAANRLVIIHTSTTLPAPTVSLVSRSLRDAVISFEATGLALGADGVQSKQRWRFTFPDQSTVEVRGLMRAGEPDELEALARVAMGESGRRPIRHGDILLVPGPPSRA